MCRGSIRVKLYYEEYSYIYYMPGVGELMTRWLFEALTFFIVLGWVLMLVFIMAWWYFWTISCEAPWKAIYS